MNSFARAFPAASLLFLATFAAPLAQAQAKPEKLVTRDELRACMNSEAELAERRKGIEARNVEAKKENDAIRTERAELSEEQKTIGEDQRKMDRFDKRVKAHNVKVQASQASAATFNADLDALNKSMVAYNDKCGGISYSKEDKDAILKERETAKK